MAVTWYRHGCLDTPPPFSSGVEQLHTQRRDRACQVPRMYPPQITLSLIQISQVPSDRSLQSSQNLICSRTFSDQEGTNAFLYVPFLPESNFRYLFGK